MYFYIKDVFQFLPENKEISCVGWWRLPGLVCWLRIVWTQQLSTMDICCWLISLPSLPSINGLSCRWVRLEFIACPDSKVHGAYLGPTWVLSAPCWPHEPCYQGISDTVKPSWFISLEFFMSLRWERILLVNLILWCLTKMADIL